MMKPRTTIAGFGASMIEDHFSLMRGIIEELDRYAQSSGPPGCKFPEIEIKRRNGVFRFMARIPYGPGELKLTVEESSLVLETQTSRRAFSLPAGLNPEDVGTRFLEQTLILEFPYREEPTKSSASTAAAGH